MSDTPSDWSVLTALKLANEYDENRNLDRVALLKRLAKLLEESRDLPRELDEAIKDRELAEQVAETARAQFTAITTERAAIADAVRASVRWMPVDSSGRTDTESLADRIRAGHYAPTGEGGGK